MQEQEKGFEKTFYIQLPRYMLDETNEEYNNIRAWARDASKKINNGKIAGVCAPSHPDIKMYLE